MELVAVGLNYSEVALKMECRLRKECRKIGFLKFPKAIFENGRISKSQIQRKASHNHRINQFRIPI